MKKVLTSTTWKVWLAFWMMIAMLTIPAPRADAESFSYFGYPKGTVGISKPTIGFELGERNGLQVGSFNMKLDQKLVSGTFDKETMSFTYTPTAGLTPGEHSVEVQLQFTGYQTVHLNWTFTVADNPISEVPAAYSQNRQLGLKAINDYRMLYGLKPVKLNGNLTLAAQLHAQYLFTNRAAETTPSVSLHDQKKGLPGYIGATPSERAVYAGYFRGVGENVSFKTGNLVDSIDQLFDAPYHRKPFLMPHVTEAGIEMVGDYVVIMFGYGENSETEMTVSPAPGDPYVPLIFDGYENPDPIRMHAARDYPVGYPLKVVVTGKGVGEVQLLEATLKDESGQPVKLLQNSPSNDDHLTNSVILIPPEPLKPDTSYAAYVKLGVTVNGVSQTLEKAWNFHTEPVRGIGKQKLHTDIAAYVKLTEQKDRIQHVVTFKLDDDSYTVDNVPFPLKRAPFIEEGTSYLWVRDLAAALGAEVTWDDERKAAVYTKNGRVITFFTGRNVYAINGIEHTTESPARLVDELTMIPVRLLSEVLGAQVEYLPETRTVKIVY
ncbi:MULTISPECIES: stalk domain-containing protein [Paenibacillus]|uniref:stalk domain-containing protein n=1 Tax=Paenibacillus TaxID=44249 RepID=UPI002814F13E|nr:stalk domain-containing protein [Paenibacillus sp. JMULE4]